MPPALLTSEAGTLIIHCVLLASGKWQFHADPLSLIARTAHATVKVAVKFNKTHTYADVHMYVSVYICIHIYYRKICLNLFFLETLQTSQSRTNFDVFPFACRAKVFHFFCFCTFHKLHYWKIYEVARQWWFQLCRFMSKEIDFSFASHFLRHFDSLFRSQEFALPFCLVW